MEPMLTLSEVCVLLRITDDTLLKEIKDQKLTATKVRGQWRFTQDAVEEYLDSRTIKAKRKKQVA